MSDPNNDSYDLSGAALVSTRLAGSQALPTKTPLDDPVRPSTVKFGGRAEALRRGATSVPISRPSEPPSSQIPSLGSPENWEQFAARARHVASAEVASVVDAHGLVIAAEGPSAQSEGERVGARLLVALDQAKEIDETQGKVAALEVAGSWLTAVRSFEHSPPITLILKTERPLSQSRLTALSTALSQFRRG